MSFGIGGYPLRDAAMLALYNIVIWTLVGVAVAACVRPTQTDTIKV
jgi:hypothetical protein